MSFLMIGISSWVASLISIEFIFSSFCAYSSAKLPTWKPTYFACFCVELQILKKENFTVCMTNEELFEELKSVANELGIRVRFETGDFDGGYCLLREEKMLVLNRRSTVPKKIRTLSMGLAEYGLDGLYVKPNVREAIEDELAKAMREANS